jgi:hypothetical protein
MTAFAANLDPLLAKRPHGAFAKLVPVHRGSSEMTRDTDA